MELTRTIQGEEYVFTARVTPGTPDSFMEPGDGPELGTIRVFGPSGSMPWEAFETWGLGALGENEFRAFETELEEAFYAADRKAAEEGDQGCYEEYMASGGDDW